VALSGSPVTAAGLQGLTILFVQLLMRITKHILLPGVYLYLAIAAVEAAIEHQLLSQLRELLSWLFEKMLRMMIYGFTFFLSMTGVISGATDALALKTTKAAVSGMIPVVGSILSDASESLLAGAATAKNTIGVLGMLAVLSISLLPFFQVGIQYLIMKMTAACSGVIGLKPHVSMLKNISTAMGMVTALTGACGILLLISGACCMKVAS
jgi:stage III sporulation protein AE